MVKKENKETVMDVENKESISSQKKSSKKKEEKIPAQIKAPTLKLKTNRAIAMDFSQKVYQKFDKLIKSVILFGSTVKNNTTISSDIDIIIIIDDASIRFDNELIAWYREELNQIIKKNPYAQDLHINTIKLTTWWYDISQGDPTVINVIRHGETLIDFGGFFTPLKALLQQGKIRSSPEAIFTALNRVSGHIIRSKIAEISAIEGCYWAYVDSAQALLMTAHVSPPSPEHIPELLAREFSQKKLLDPSFIREYKEIFTLHKKINHGEIKDLPGKVIDTWQERSEKFYKKSLELIKEILR